ncbi:MAG: hypothetical protein WA030_03690 [Candidatus Microsaccharimonas sp.]
MASNEEINLRRDTQESVINDFRDYYSAKSDTRELASESLVSHHDPSIRFTNSTTSVMKPLLLEPSALDQVTYLAQPAMGQQGLFYWQRDHVFGPYASYFASLGALYPTEQQEQSLVDMIAIAKQWCIEDDQLALAVHESDEDLAEFADNASIPIRIGSDEDDFRHSYGLETIIGRNLNLEMRDRSHTLRTLGNLTLIQTIEGQPLSYEVSFDSTTATSFAHKLAHPVFAHYQLSDETGNGESLATSDTLSVTAALLVEGLTPVSKGRSGTLRKFMLEYIRLAKNLYGATNTEITNTLKQASHEEIVFRERVSPARRSDASYAVAKETIDQWADPLSQRIDDEIKRD